MSKILEIKKMKASLTRMAANKMDQEVRLEELNQTIERVKREIDIIEKAEKDLEIKIKELEEKKDE